ncbi:hypothetical protein TRICI_001683 [Trichomonascus ciferrii]|uniref:Uncharacterized protein n=1 Tax=Trichomonascus ciferrii TaxID=44093 RepID=A0A642V7X5_9ASCO|nr:hypothetical protein TRICI_001683 [Trichomonascus ciferrii]
MMFKKIGDNVLMEDHLFLTTEKNELYIYKVFAGQKEKELVLTKIPEPSLMEYKNCKLKYIPDLNGMSCVFVTGDVPSLISKTSQSFPRVHRFTTEPIYGFTTFNTENIYNGFAYANDSEVVRMGKLYQDVDYSQSLPVHQIPLGSSITSLCYHEEGGVYIVSTQDPIPYDYVDEDSLPVSGRIEDLQKAVSYRSSIKVISPLTWTVIGSVDLDDNEVVMVVKSVRLTVSEAAKRKKEFVAFGTSILRGEDLASKGAFYVYEVIDVVPEPGMPETNRKFKEVARESVKGAVTALCEVDGHLLVSQAQKVIVRNIQEDNSIIPVAFLDLNVYISDAKSLKNLLVLSDAVKSVWLVGFAQEPYRMNVVSKDLSDIGVTCSEFAVHGKSLYVLSSDTERKIHLLQYEPDDPASLSGQRLLRRSEFFTGRTINDMIMVPTSEGDSNFMPFAATSDGTLIGVIPVSESSYRRLFVMQQQIIDKEEQNCCLNPRMHRSHGTESATGRAILDYNTIKRFVALSTEKKSQYGRKLGKGGYNEGRISVKEIEKAMAYF